MLVRLFAVLIAATSTTGCASIVHGEKQKIRVETDPPGMNFVVYPSGESATTPTKIEFLRNQPYSLRIQNDGYKDETVLLSPVSSGWVFGNLLVGGLIGMNIDITSGAGFKLTPSKVILSLEPIEKETEPLRSSD